MEYMRHTNSESRRIVSLPSVAFALSFVLLGWITSHSVAYALVDLLPGEPAHDHHAEGHVHDYMGVLKLIGGIGLVLAFAIALRMFFRHGTFGEWLREDSLSGTVKQVTLSTVLPAAVFVLAEYLERLVAGTGTYPSTVLLTVGVLAQLAVGLLCLALVRFTFRVTERIIRSIGRLRLVRFVRRATGYTVKSVVYRRLPCPMADSAGGRAPPF
jgi:hypothetical protein